MDKVEALTSSGPDTKDKSDWDDDGDADGPPPLDPPASCSSTSFTHGESEPASLTGLVQAVSGLDDTILLLDLPDVFTVGYDAWSFTAHRFTGVKHVPPGPHFLWVAHPSGVAARAGVWLLGSASRHHVHVVQWDRSNEVLTKAADGSSLPLRAGSVGNVEASLVSYADPSKTEDFIGELPAPKAESNLGIWRQLTSDITEALLNRVAGMQDGGWFVHTLDRARDAEQFPPQLQAEQAIPSERQLSFTVTRSTRLFRLESFGSERSSEALDPSAYLLSLVGDASRSFTPHDLIGELQFSFITGLLLGNDSCLDQWWFMILTLIVKSYRLIQEKPRLSTLLWHALTAQFIFGTQWMDINILDLTEHNCRELQISLIVYKRRLDEFLQDATTSASSDHLAVGNAFSRLESVLTGLGWDLTGSYVRKGKVTLEDGEEVDLELSELEAEDERGEWAPEVVELDEHGRQLGLVSWTN